jgi:peptidoglycan/LPS O-acetylase OafA/YrhL
MSLEYAWVNALLGILLAGLAWRYPNRWRLWAFCALLAALHFVLILCYINRRVSFRYYATVLPVVVFAASVAVAGACKWWRGRRARTRPLRAAKRVTRRAADARGRAVSAAMPRRA